MKKKKTDNTNNENKYELVQKQEDKVDEPPPQDKHEESATDAPPPPLQEKENQSIEIDEEEEEKLSKLNRWKRSLSKLFNKYCIKYCCCCCKKCFPDAKVHMEDEANPSDDNEKPTEEVKPVNIAPIVKKVANNFEEVFWPRLWKDLISRRVNVAAAITIQRVIRGHLGRELAYKLRREAIRDMNAFWEMQRNKKLMDRNRRQIELEVRNKLANSLVRKLLSKEISKKARLDAACVIQRFWRGYVGRSIYSYYLLLAHQLRIKKPKIPPSRFRNETFRRIWARKNFEPKGGWPGKMDYIQYDMWEYADEPPEGLGFGMKTHKIKAAPQTEKEKEILLNDQNAWVGVPVQVNTGVEMKKRSTAVSGVMQSLTTSPYRNPVVKHDESISKPRRLTGMQALKAMGWRKEYIYKIEKPDAALEQIKQIEEVYNRPFSYMDSSDFIKENSVELPNNDQLNESQFSPSKSQIRGARKPRPGLPHSEANQAVIESLKSTHKSALELSRDMERQLVHLSTSQPDATQFEAKGIVKQLNKEFEESSTPVKKQLKSASTAWNQLKNDVSMISGLSASHTLSSPDKKKSKAPKRVTPWPQAVKTYFKFDYTWIPQPLVKRAAVEIHEDKGPTEEDLAQQEEERKKNLAPVAKLAAIKDEATVSTLTELRSFENKMNMKIRDERLQAKPLIHPYHWL